MSFPAITAVPFKPLGIQKMKILKKWKKLLEMSLSYTCVQKSWSHDAWFLKFKAWQMSFFVILGQFLPFYPPNNPTNQNFEKMIKLSGDIFILHLWTTMIIIWCMVPDIWISTTEFCGILDIFYPFTPKGNGKSKFWKNEKNDWTHYYFIYVYHKWKSWCMVPKKWSTTNRIFCHFGPFLPFYHTNNLKNQNFENMKKISGDIIILHFCNTNDNHMMYGFRDMECDRQNFVIFDQFFPFYPL